MEASESETPTLTATHATEDGVVVVEFDGTIELATVPRAKELLQEAWPDSEPKILFDLSKVGFVDSAGLGFMIGTLRRASEAGGELKLAGLSAYLLGIFELVNLQTILKVYKTREAALEDFRG